MRTSATATVNFFVVLWSTDVLNDILAIAHYICFVGMHNKRVWFGFVTEWRYIITGWLYFAAAPFTTISEFKIRIRQAVKFT